MANKVFFDVTNVKLSMSNLENKFNLFSDVLTEINSYIETEINAGVDSAIFGEYGSKLLQIWSANASTFGDFHANFESWSEAVAVISANNNEFKVDTAALYRDNGSSLSGVQDARKYKVEGGEYKSLNSAAKSVLKSAQKEKTATWDSNNKYGGRTITYTDLNGNQVILYYDDDGEYVGKEVASSSGKKYYDAKNKEVNSLVSSSQHEKDKASREKKAKELDKEAQTYFYEKYSKHEFVYYNQGDYHQAYAGETIAAAGCGPTSAAMVMTYLTGKEVTPPMACEFSTKHGYACNGNGTYEALFPAIAKNYGLNAKQEVHSTQNIINSLKEGNVIIAHMGPGHFTRGGHYIVLQGLDKNGNVIVQDPASRDRSGKSYPASLIASESKGTMCSIWK